MVRGPGIDHAGDSLRPVPAGEQAVCMSDCNAWLHVEISSTCD